MKRNKLNLVLFLLTVILTSGCSVAKRTAVNQVSNAMVSGGSTFSSENDPELVRDAAPFTLKLMETLLAETPGHQGLLSTLASGFTQYSYAFVQMDADIIESKDFEAAERMRDRARLLYLRARDYALRGLDQRHEGFSENLITDPHRIQLKATIEDVPDLFWAAVSWAGAISLGKDDPELISDLPKVEYLIDLAYLLDPDFEDGAIETFLVSYEMNRSAGEGDASERCRYHFDRAVKLSGGDQVAPYVAYAESVVILQQNMDEFVDLLDKALAVDVDQHPEWRLVNLVNQRRARWLLDNREDFILE